MTPSPIYTLFRSPLLLPSILVKCETVALSQLSNLVHMEATICTRQPWDSRGQPWVSFLSRSLPSGMSSLRVCGMCLCEMHQPTPDRGWSLLVSLLCPACCSLPGQLPQHVGSAEGRRDILLSTQCLGGSQKKRPKIGSLVTAILTRDSLLYDGWSYL